MAKEEFEVILEKHPELALLSSREMEVFEQLLSDKTLAEIAEEFGISRAAVHDSLKSAEKSLQEYEQKLKLVTKFMATSAAIGKIDEMIDRVAETYADNESLVASLEEIKSVINGLEDV